MIGFVLVDVGNGGLMKTHDVIKLLSFSLMLLGFSSLFSMKRTNNDQFEQPEAKRVLHSDLDDLCCSFTNCDRNHEPFTHELNLRSHLMTQHNVCWYCPDLGPFASRAQLVQHCKDMQHERTFCQYCENHVTKCPHNLATHERNCLIRLERKKYSLRRDQLFPKDLKCPFCGKDCNRKSNKFISMNSLKSHLVTKHYICLKCPSLPQFESIKDFIEHCIIASNSEHEIYCQYCKNFIYPEKKYLKNHKKLCLSRQGSNSDSVPEVCNSSDNEQPFGVPTFNNINNNINIHLSINAPAVYVLPEQGAPFVYHQVPTRYPVMQFQEFDQQNNQNQYYQPRHYPTQSFQSQPLPYQSHQKPLVPGQRTLLCDVAPLVSCNIDTRVDNQTVASNNNSNNNVILYCQYCHEFQNHDAAILQAHEEHCLYLQDLLRGKW